VTFRHPGTDRDAIHAIDVHLPAGSTIAIVGENGAGKTTLVKLLAGLHQPTGGTIHVDGVDLRTIDPARWNAATAGAFQDHARLELTVQHSIGLGDLPHRGDPAAVTAAVDRAGATDLLDTLDHGLDTQLGTRWSGRDLSGGQWQKVAVARAMMRTTPLLLVLDEPTSALDAETEHRLFGKYAAAARRQHSRGAITLLVSHRFSTVRHADLILVLAQGRLAESGTHDDLIETGGIYAELYRLQASGYA
jgi:ATP-binding cassette subfamily B protein